MSFGTFLGVGHKAAREKRHDAEKLRDQRQDPVVVREAKRQEDEKLRHTFRAVGEEWAITKLEKENKARATIKRERWNLRQLYRELRERPLCEIDPPELLTALRRVETRDRFYTVDRLRSTASRVFQFGVGGTLVLLGQSLCKSPEAFKAWSQNLGHEHLLTTFRSYGNLDPHRQAEFRRSFVSAELGTQG